MSFLSNRLSLLIAIFSLLSLISSVGSEAQPNKFRSCIKSLVSRDQHKPKVKIQTLNETDQALWKASGNGNREVGVVELVSSDGQILAATDYVYQAQTGKLILNDIHVPIKEAFFNFIQKIEGRPGAAAVRFTHVHPKILSSGVLYFSPNWIFSQGDRQAGYSMKFLLEQCGLANLSLEMHLVYQAPFASRPKKKMYSIDSRYTWANGDYSMGDDMDRQVKAILSERGR